jgi:hypothetical protein
VHINMTVKIFAEFQVILPACFVLLRKKNYCGTTEARKVVYGSGKPYVYP